MFEVPIGIPIVMVVLQAMHRLAVFGKDVGDVPVSLVENNLLVDDVTKIYSGQHSKLIHFFGFP